MVKRAPINTEDEPCVKRHYSRRHSGRSWVGAFLATGLALGGMVGGMSAPRAQGSQASTLPQQRLDDVNKAYREQRYWDALSQLRQLEAQAPGERDVTVYLARVLQDMGAFGAAAWHVDQLMAQQEGKVSLDLKAWRQRLRFSDQEQALYRGREASRLKVALGMIDLDPAQAFMMMEELAENLALLDEASVDELIRQLEVLGYVDKASEVAGRALLLASSPQAQALARQRVAEVQARAARSVNMQGKVSFPGGEFKLGTTRKAWRRNGKRDIDLDERPAHKVTLSPYALGTHEVTAQSYRRCQIEGACPPPRIPVSFKDPLEPMVGISWEGAAAYCRAIGGRLPTEAEWEAAARGTQGRTWPWGEAPPTCDHAQYRGCEFLVGSVSFNQRPSPVGMHPEGATPEGLHDMAGNVAEWVFDGYAPDGYENLARANPKGPTGVNLKVTRGGSFDRKAHEIRSARRESRTPSQGYNEVGVRCAFEAEFP